MADALVKPDKGEDVRLLWRYVAELVKRINALLNMTGDFESTLFHGHGSLTVVDSYAEMRISTGGDEGDAAGQNKKHTDVVVASSDSPSEYGETIHWIAAVAIDATGTIQFYIDGGGFGPPVTISGGLAISNTTSNLSSGTHEIRAHYSGDAKYLDASGTFNQKVNALNPPVMQVVATPNPAEKGIDFVTFIAAVVGQNPIPPAPPITGVVRFFIDGSAFDDRTLVHYSGQEWRCDTSDDAINYLDAGDHNIIGVYMGDRNYGTANDLTVLHVKMGSTCTLSADPEYVEPNNNFTLSAVVSPFGGHYPTGTVQFYKDGAAYGGPVNLVNGEVAVSVNAGPDQGTQTWAFSYSGDSFFMPDVSNNITIHVQVESPMPYEIVATPTSVTGNAATFTLEAQNQDSSHNAFTGPMDIELLSPGWSSGHLVLADLDDSGFITLVPNDFTLCENELVFTGGYANNVQLTLSGFDNSQPGGDGCSVKWRGSRHGQVTFSSAWNYVTFNVPGP